MKGSVGTFFEHLEELRRRVVVLVVFFVVVSVLSYPFVGGLLSHVIRDQLGTTRLVILSPQEAVIAYIKTSIFIGFILTIPLFIYELWSFIEPALNPAEKKLLAYSIIPSLLLFSLGVLFAYFILLPITLNFLLSESLPVAEPMLSLDATITFILFMLLVVGFSFQLPLIVAVLAKIHLLDYKTLSNKRRYVILSIFIFAAIVTPDTTFFSQLIVSIPLIVLYEFSVQISRFIH